MFTFLKKLVIRVGNQYVRQIIKNEFYKQHFSYINERPVELQFAFQHLVKLCPRKLLDIGAGTTSFPHLLRNCGFVVTAIDNYADYWGEKVFNRHWYVLKDDIRSPSLQKRFDLITCISVLEHIKEHELAIKGMMNLLKPKGHLIITIPYNENQYIGMCINCQKQVMVRISEQYARFILERS